MAASTRDDTSEVTSHRKLLDCHGGLYASGIPGSVSTNRDISWPVVGVILSSYTAIRWGHQMSPVSWTCTVFVLREVTWCTFGLIDYANEITPKTSVYTVLPTILVFPFSTLEKVVSYLVARTIWKYGIVTLKRRLLHIHMFSIKRSDTSYESYGRLVGHESDQMIISWHEGMWCLAPHWMKSCQVVVLTCYWHSRFRS